VLKRAELVVLGEFEKNRVGTLLEAFWARGFLLALTNWEGGKEKSTASSLLTYLPG
jgi:hypothetical protein